VTLELLKLIVQPVVLERADDGSLTGERLGDPTAVYTEQQLLEFMQALRDEVDAANRRNGDG
jgi:hypothetical protein